jgi:hypothetical protein
MVHRWKDEPAFQATIVEIRTQKNDRAAATVAVATVEYALQLAIEARYQLSIEGRKKLFDSGPQSPLSTLYSKIEFASAMGVIDQKTSEDLHILRKIRNEFAHEINPVSFNSGNILPLCEKLPVPGLLQGGNFEESTEINERLRKRFVEQVFLLLLLLIGDLDVESTYGEKGLK